MKFYLMVSIFFVFSTLSSNSLAAIGCLPGDCCNGRPCGNPEPAPRPPVPPHCPPQLGRGGARTADVVLKLTESELQCPIQVKQNCSQCDGDASSCEMILESGVVVEAICKYCN